MERTYKLTSSLKVISNLVGHLRMIADFFIV